MSCREGVCDAAHEVLVSLVEAACGLWEGGVFVGFQSLQSVTVDSIHRRRVTNILSIGINTLPLDNHCFHSNRIDKVFTNFKKFFVKVAWKCLQKSQNRVQLYCEIINK